jgi:hypothetical protein
MESRTDRVGLLLDQLETSRELSWARLGDLTDEEYLWEPAPGAWSVRRRGEAATSGAFGPGEWVIDRERIDPFRPGPLTTIAWRLGHLICMFAGRWEWTFGGRTIPPEDCVEFTGSAKQALADLSFHLDRWRDGIAGLTDEQLDEAGYGQYPWGLDPQLPFISIVWWNNRELIHHLAEVALLRDLWSRRGQLTR